MNVRDALEWVERNCTPEAIGRLRSRKVAATLAAENKELREALDRLARLGNEPLYGNSVGNVIAQHALAKYKENKDA